MGSGYIRTPRHIICRRLFQSKFLINDNFGWRVIRIWERLLISIFYPYTLGEFKIPTWLSIFTADSQVPHQGLASKRLWGIFYIFHSDWHVGKPPWNLINFFSLFISSPSRTAIFVYQFYILQSMIHNPARCLANAGIQLKTSGINWSLRWLYPTMMHLDWLFLLSHCLLWYHALLHWSVLLLLFQDNFTFGDLSAQWAQHFLSSKCRRISDV